MPVSFIVSAGKTFVEKLPEGVRSGTLIPKVYSLEYSKNDGFFLTEIIDKFTTPEKTYGDYPSLSDRIYKTYLGRKSNTGILLTGLKGTGKSLFVKFVSNKMIEMGYPVIQINKPFPGEEIFNFIESLGDCVLLFDEFGKNYKSYATQNEPSQVSLLSLLDGLSNSKRLHLFTENSVRNISEFLIDRPSRVYYHFKYNRLSDKIIREYCSDNKLSENIIDEILAKSTMLKVLSFDVLAALVTEWKNFGGNISDHIEILNVTKLKDINNPIATIVAAFNADGSATDDKTYKVISNGESVTIEHLKSDSVYPDNYYFTARDAVCIRGDIYDYLLPTGVIVSVKINDIDSI